MHSESVIVHKKHAAKLDKIDEKNNKYEKQFTN